MRLPLFLVGSRFDPVFVERGCVKGVATDSGNVLDRVDAYRDTRLVRSSTASSFAFAFDIISVHAEAQLRVVATTNGTRSPTRAP